MRLPRQFRGWERAHWQIICEIWLSRQGPYTQQRQRALISRLQGLVIPSVYTAVLTATFDLAGEVFQRCDCDCKFRVQHALHWKDRVVKIQRVLLLTSSPGKLAKFLCVRLLMIRNTGCNGETDIVNVSEA